jgi:hypothetical protein
MVILRNYMADTVARVVLYDQALPQQSMLVFRNVPPVHSHVAAINAGHYQPPQGPQWQHQGPMQSPGYHMGPPMLTTVYPAGNCLYESSSILNPVLHVGADPLVCK